MEAEMQTNKMEVQCRVKWEKVQEYEGMQKK